MTESLRVLIDSNAYVNVSVGHPSVTLILKEQNICVIFGTSIEPPFDSPPEDFLKLAGRSDGRSMLLSITDLAPDDVVWVRNDPHDPEDPETELRVVRGVAKVFLSTA